jgi:hypothetical protein
MSPEMINAIAFFGSITLIMFCLCLWLRSKHGQRWLEKHS